MGGKKTANRADPEVASEKENPPWAGNSQQRNGDHTCKGVGAERFVVAKTFVSLLLLCCA